MARPRKNIPQTPSREKGQRSLDEAWIQRYIPPWAFPTWQTAEFWRTFVRSVPVALDCRETLISYMTSLTWKIEPRDSQKRDELRDTIKYHTDLFEHGGYFDYSGWDFIKLLEWLLTDALDTPFGGAAETIREGDSRSGKVLKIIPIDSATLYPTRNKDVPVIQWVDTNPDKKAIFPSYAINRIYMSPRTEMKREGWGMAPPEKIFLALELLRRGDTYYARTLLDTPEAGILDLMNMEESAAKDWIKGFKELYTGIDSMKIPVLYEHTMKAEWIPFGKPPTDLMFDRIYHQYAALVCSGYGLTPTDIGLPSVGGGGGQTLAGSIRDERRTRRSGIARLKDTTRYFFNRMLSPEIQFVWIDLDDEYSIALSRARLANATAMNQYIQSRIFTEKEARLQTLADGLFTIGVPEEVDESEFITQTQENPERPGILGSPVKPSLGGHGEAKSVFGEILLSNFDISDTQIRKLAKNIIPIMQNELEGVLELSESDIYNWTEWHTKALYENEYPSEITQSTIQLSEKSIDSIAKQEEWFSVETQDVTKAVRELVDQYRKMRSDKIIAKSMDDYENGKTQTWLKYVEPNTDLEKSFRTEIRQLVRKHLSELSVSKGVIAGVRNSIIKIGLVGLSEDGLHDNINLVTEVRNELAFNYKKSLSNFYYQAMNLISHYLEEEENGKE